MTAATFSPIPATPDQLADLSRDLIALGERMERSGSPNWLTVARAAAVLDGLRLDLLTVVPHGCH